MLDPMYGVPLGPRAHSSGQLLVPTECRKALGENDLFHFVNEELNGMLKELILTPPAQKCVDLSVREVFRYQYNYMSRGQGSSGNSSTN